MQVPNQEMNQQLSDAVFHNRYPDIELKPFATKVWRHGPLTNITIPAELRPWPDDVIKAHPFSTERFEFLAEVLGVLVESIHQLFPTALLQIQNSLAAEVSGWICRILDELPIWVESAESIVQWEVMKSAGVDTVLPMPLTTLQHVWILLNRNRERKETADMWTTLLDRLYPWLNFDLWREIQRSEDARENVAYATDHEAFVSGYAPEEEDLDEIRVIGSI